MNEKISLLGKQRPNREKETPKTTFIFVSSCYWLYWKYNQMNPSIWPNHLLWNARFFFQLVFIFDWQVWLQFYWNTMSTSMFCEEMVNVVVWCNFNWGKFRTFYICYDITSHFLCVCVCLLMSISRLTKTRFSWKSTCFSYVISLFVYICVKFTAIAQ